MVARSTATARLADAAHAIVHLVLQQLRCRLEQIERDEALGELARHLVAIGADGDEVVGEFVEQGQRLDGIEPVGFAIEIETAEIIR